MLSEEEVFALFLAPVIAGIGGLGNEPLDALDSSTFWKVQGIEQTVDHLVPMIAVEEPDKDLAALKQLVDDLGSPEFLKRQKAMMALSKAGPEVIPLLNEATKSDDPEVVKSAKTILARFTAEADNDHIERLMAIRSLGEMQAKEAIPHLEKLLESSDLFVADYAARALAEIKGEEYEVKRVKIHTIEDDLKIGCPELSILAHVRAQPREGDVLFPDLLVTFSDLLNKIEGGGFFGMSLPRFGFPKPDVVLREFHREFDRPISTLGNFRLDSCTAMLPSDITPRTGAFVFIFRGLYDHEHFESLLRASARSEPTDIEGRTWFLSSRRTCILCASDELLIMTGGPDAEDYARLVTNRMSGKDKTPSSGPAIELLKTVPKDAEMFITLTFPEAIREREEILQVVDSFTAWITPPVDGQLEFHAKLVSSREKEIKEWFQRGEIILTIAQGGAVGLPLPAERREWAGKFIDSIKFQREESTLTLEATIPERMGER